MALQLLSDSPTYRNRGLEILGEVACTASQGMGGTAGTDRPVCSFASCVGTAWMSTICTSWCYFLGAGCTIGAPPARLAISVLFPVLSLVAV